MLVVIPFVTNSNYQVRLSAWIIKEETEGLGSPSPVPTWVTGQAAFPSRSLRGHIALVHPAPQECPLASKTQALPCPLPETVELMKMATLLDGGAGRGPT